MKVRSKRQSVIGCMACLFATLHLDRAALAEVQPPEVVKESARGIPVGYEVDVAVVGGGSGAVAAAVEAARSGARVFLAAEHPYLQR